MSDPKSWIDVAHTAVQVGLGALIGGGLTLIVKRTESDLAKKQEIRKRRLELLQDSAYTADELYHEVVKLVTAGSTVCTILDEKPAGVCRDDLIREARKQHGVDLDSCLKTAFRAQSNLAIVVETECANQMREYLSSIASLNSLVNAGSHELSVELIDRDLKKIRSLRELLQNNIGHAFTRPW